MQNCGCKGTKNYANNIPILNYFRIFVANFNDLMKDYTPLIGILLIIVGTCLLLGAYLAHYTTNTLLGLGLVFITAGIVGYILAIKHTDRY